jgi:hypothetical protein
MKHNDETYILALDVRHSRIGYALFAGPKQLLDWGASTVPSQCIHRTSWVQQRMKSLLRHGSPVFLVVKQPRPARPPANANGKPIIEAILSAAKEYGIPIQLLSHDEMLSAFRIFNVRTKDDIACVLVGMFPELLIRLPPRRKKWQPEPHGMIVFDAIATGFAYWRSSPSHE